MEPLRPTDPVRVGEFELAARLGQGGMGEVYLGVSPTGDKVAVKMIRSDLVSEEQVRQRFAAEVDSLKMVYGARVARFEGADLDAEPAWLATEYVPGRTLYQHLAAEGPLEPRLAAMLGATLAEGLGKIHEVGLLHRDLKPHNILLGPDGPKLIDFGLAVLRERDHQLTESGMVVGTIAYMSPEQARGERDLTPAADVYALGAILMSTLTGRSLYAPARGYALRDRIIDPHDHPDMGGVPLQLAPLLGAMLAFDPSARPVVPVVLHRLLSVATADGATVERMRQLLVADTYVEPEPIVVPARAADPRADDSDLETGARPVSVPPASSPARSASPHASHTAPTGAATAAGAATAPPPADVAWLVEDLRHRYARTAPL